MQACADGWGEKFRDYFVNPVNFPVLRPSVEFLLEQLQLEKSTDTEKKTLGKAAWRAIFSLLDTFRGRVTGLPLGPMREVL